MNFIYFGCWNNGNCNVANPETNLSQVMKKITEFKNLKDLKDSNRIDFAVIAGDNYYAPKDKAAKASKEAKADKEDKPKADKEDKVKKEKVKIFNGENFISGVNCLKTSLPGINKYILLGNHEYDKVTGLEEDDNKCNLMRLQQRTFTSTDNFNFFTDVMTKQSTNTLIIMIDTTLYEYHNDMDKYCNEVFPSITNRTYENLTKHQEDLVKGILIGNLDKKNIVIIGHHPIVTLKAKEDKIKIEALEGLVKLFKNISALLKDKNIYYLCADNHLQQKGIITIDDLTINQYVSGTGGAELDKCIKSDGTRTFEIGDVSYDMQECKSTNGFYYVKENGDNLEFNFQEVAVPEQKGGYREKYLKYKQKYLNLKKNLI
jgi:hypothetical protein